MPDAQPDPRPFLQWGQGPRVFHAFLEPTCPNCARAFPKLKRLLDLAGEDVLALRITLHSQPWHPHSGVVSRAVLAAAADGGRDVAWQVMAQVFDNRSDFDPEDHCRGEGMLMSPADAVVRISKLLGRDLSASFIASGVTDALKRHTRFARQNGIHVSPTFMVDGLVDDKLGSRDEVEAWASRIGLT